MSTLADSLAYQEALEAAGVKPGDVIGFAYRSVPLIPTVDESTGKPKLNRMRTPVKLVAFHKGHIAFEYPDGTITIDPLSEVLIEKPSEEALHGRLVQPVSGIVRP